MDEFNELIGLNKYFETALAMIPNYDLPNTDNLNHRKRAYDSQTLKKGGPNAKKSKVNPHLLKAMDKFKQSTDSNEDENSEFVEKKKPLINKDTNCSLNELHERLQKKLEELRQQREPKNPRKRGKRKKKDKKQHIAQGTKTTEVDLDLNPTTASERKADRSQSTDTLVTKEGKVVFSKFDFSQMVGKYSTNKSTKKNKLPSSKNYELLLLKAAREKEKVDKIKKEDPKKASAILQKSSWEKAMARAEGEKVRDDPALLKKSLKRKLAKKKKSVKEWQARTEQMEQNMRKRQEKKQRNVQKRKEHKQNRKVFKRAKKTPGF